MYIDYQSLLKKINRKPQKIVLEDREALKYKSYCCVNHAELIEYMNPADNCPWDVILPGYPFKLLEQPGMESEFYTNLLLAVLELSDGNHKFFMIIDYPGYNIKKIFIDIHNYVESYLIKNKKLTGNLVFI